MTFNSSNNNYLLKLLPCSSNIRSAFSVTLAPWGHGTKSFTEYGLQLTEQPVRVIQGNIVVPDRGACLVVRPTGKSLTKI